MGPFGVKHLTDDDAFPVRRGRHRLLGAGAS